MKQFNILLFILLVKVFFLDANADIHGRGASFPKIVYLEWIKKYEEETGKTITYNPTGSGDGIVSIVKRKSDFSGSDKPLRSWRLKRYKLNMFPTLVGSIVLAYNIPGVGDTQLKLSEKAIAAIFSGEAKFWDDERITKNNSKLNLPHEPIKVAVRADGSGTTFNFVSYLRKIDYTHFKKAKKKFDWQADIISADGSSKLSELIDQTPYSIGYVDYSKKLKYVLNSATVQNKEGNWVLPTLEAAKNGAKNANLEKEKDFYGVIAYQDGKYSYPLIATTYVLLPYETKSINQEVLEFFNWALQNGEEIANKHGFSMLPHKTIEDVKSYWVEKKLYDGRPYQATHTPPLEDDTVL